MLHIVNKSPDNNALSSCLRVAQPGSAILLIEDGVYAAATEATLLQSSCVLYALEADVKARGQEGRLLEGIELVDYSGFVELTERYPSAQSWY